MILNRVLEYFEARFRSYRFSDKDVEVMDKKGYYFDGITGRFRKENGKRGLHFDLEKARHREEWLKPILYTGTSDREHGFLTWIRNLFS